MPDGLSGSRITLAQKVKGFLFYSDALEHFHCQSDPCHLSYGNHHGGGSSEDHPFMEIYGWA